MRPGLYNFRRLLEAPLPNLNQNTVDRVPDSTQNPGVENVDNNIPSNSGNNDSDEATHQNDSIESFDELVVSSSSDGIQNIGTDDLDDSRNGVQSTETNNWNENEEVNSNDGAQSTDTNNSDENQEIHSICKTLK